jgi:hypothetical protein
LKIGEEQGEIASITEVDSPASPCTRCASASLRRCIEQPTKKTVFVCEVHQKMHEPRKEAEKGQNRCSCMQEKVANLMGPRDVIPREPEKANTVEIE